MKTDNPIVITGAAGFIGMHLTETLCRKGFDVIGVDNFTPAYGGLLCEQRAQYLKTHFDLEIIELNLAETSSVPELESIFRDAHSVIHLAAWPGVRQGQLVPNEYSKSNLTGFTNVIEAVRLSKPRQFMFASSSSIYGDLGSSGPVSEDQANGLNARSFYAATKWANEIIARQHSQISGIPTFALRFFTVYGEFGRPDMAYWNFLERILENTTIDLYGKTGGSRNYTYVKDCAELVSRLVQVNRGGYLPINIALDEPKETIYFLKSIAEAVKQEPKIRIIDRPLVDVEKTWANTELLNSLVGTVSPTPMNEAVSSFVQWFMKHRDC